MSKEKSKHVNVRGYRSKRQVREGGKIQNKFVNVVVYYISYGVYVILHFKTTSLPKLPNLLEKRTHELATQSTNNLK